MRAMHGRSDRRQAERATVRAEARLHIAETTFSGGIVDLCEGGALMRLPHAAIAPEQPCIVTIPFGRDPAESLALLARVVWRNGDRVAVRWVRPLSFDTRFKFQRLIERELGAPRIREMPIPMVIWPPRHRRAAGEQEDQPSVA
jgi:hypothetical protein